jgi:hypothetical protein
MLRASRFTPPLSSALEEAPFTSFMASPLWGAPQSKRYVNFKVHVYEFKFRIFGDVFPCVLGCPSLCGINGLEGANSLGY